MKGLLAALQTESRKMRKSKMLLATILIFAFIAIMMGLLMLIAKHPELVGRSPTLAAKARIVGSADWPSYFGLLIQTVLALGPMGYGIVAAWVFGREYSDRVIKDLLALPVSRFEIVLSKFIIILIWSAILSIILFILGLLTGLAVNIPGWSNELALHSLFVFSGSAVLTILLVTPVAFFACVGRGYLLPIGFAFLTLIITQLAGVGVPGIMADFPWAIPALSSGIVVGPEIPKVGALSFFLLGLTSFLGLAATAAWWRFADQN
jgi:ABC-2 type transport system permease protein